MVDKIHNNGEIPKHQQNNKPEIQFSAKDINIFQDINVAKNDATRVAKPTIFNDLNKTHAPLFIDQYELSVSLENTLSNSIIAKNMSRVLSLKTTSVSRKTILKNYMKHINGDNFKSILREYSKTGKREALTTSIITSSILSDKEKKAYLNNLLKKAEKHATVNKKYAGDILPEMKKIIEEYNKNSAINNLDKKRIGADLQRLTLRGDTTDTVAPKINGAIDSPTKQGPTGDCWLLSGIKSLSLTPQGKAILKNSIQIDSKTGNVKVTLKGVGKSYTITRQEIKNATDLSKGDDDMRAIELATNKYYRQTAQNGKIDIWGGTGAMTFALFTGNKGISVVRNQKAITEGINKFSNSKNSIAAVTSMHGKKPKEINSTVNGKRVNLYNSHAYTLQSVSKDAVYLVNPHDTSKPIKIPRNEYLKNFDSLCLKDFNAK